MAANDIVLVAPKRTAVGSFGGAFKNTPRPRAYYSNYEIDYQYIGH